MTTPQLIEYGPIPVFTLMNLLGLKVPSLTSSSEDIQTKMKEISQHWNSVKRIISSIRLPSSKLITLGKEDKFYSVSKTIKNEEMKIPLIPVPTLINKPILRKVENGNFDTERFLIRTISPSNYAITQLTEQASLLNIVHENLHRIKNVVDGTPIRNVARQMITDDPRFAPFVFNHGYDILFLAVEQIIFKNTIFKLNLDEGRFPIKIPKEYADIKEIFSNVDLLSMIPVLQNREFINFPSAVLALSEKFWDTDPEAKAKAIMAIKQMVTNALYY
jgi:hypothetical protein